LLAAERILCTKDSSFLTTLCNLSVPPAQLQPMVDDLGVVPWLMSHQPPVMDIPNSPCCLPKGEDTTLPHITQARSQSIIELEQPKLLKFRNSLYAVISTLAPLADEGGQEVQGQSISSSVFD